MSKEKSPARLSPPQFVLYVKWFLITSQSAPTKGRIVMEKEWWQIRKSSLIKIAHGFLRFQKTTIYSVIYVFIPVFSVICALYNT